MLLLEAYSAHLSVRAAKGSEYQKNKTYGLGKLFGNEIFST